MRTVYRPAQGVYPACSGRATPLVLLESPLELLSAMTYLIPYPLTGLQC